MRKVLRIGQNHQKQTWFDKECAVAKEILRQLYCRYTKTNVNAVKEIYNKRGMNTYK